MLEAFGKTDCFHTFKMSVYYCQQNMFSIFVFCKVLNSGVHSSFVILAQLWRKVVWLFCLPRTGRESAESKSIQPGSGLQWLA